MERNYVTNLTRDWTTSPGEVNSGISKTVPDQSMSLADLLRRGTRGEQLSAHPVDFQDDDDDQVYHDIQKMDLSDIYEYRQYLNARVRELKKLSDAPNVESSAPSAQEPEPPKEDRQATNE